MSRRIAPMLLAGVVLAVLGAGCSAAPVERPPEPTANASASGPAASVPSDGQTLATLGYQNGPGALTVPKDVSVSVGSDQPSLVTLVFVSPDAASIYDYLSSTLVAAGFEITGQHTDQTTPALSFTGRGWTGNFTGNGATSALTLRPVA